VKKPALAEAEEFKEVENKYQQYFSENPGEGD
jgi:hypothetical protein